MQHLTATDALSHLTRSNGDFARLIEKDGFDVGLYRPDRVDTQTPHARDEIYVVAAGAGEFMLEDERAPFSPGDVIFVAAGQAHRFENFSPDFCAWVIFIGKRP
jgi:mannose-6-phosphate isomerase-like protein (cupin superfamily)